MCVCEESGLVRDSETGNSILGYTVLARDRLQNYFEAATETFSPHII